MTPPAGAIDGPLHTAAREAAAAAAALAAALRPVASTTEAWTGPTEVLGTANDGLIAAAPPGAMR